MGCDPKERWVDWRSGWWNELSNEPLADELLVDGLFGVWPDRETFTDNGEVFDVDLLPAFAQVICTDSEDVGWDDGGFPSRRRSLKSQAINLEERFPSVVTLDQ